MTRGAHAFGCRPSLLQPAARRLLPPLPYRVHRESGPRVPTCGSGVGSRLHRVRRLHRPCMHAELGSARDAAGW